VHYNVSSLRKLYKEEEASILMKIHLASINYCNKIRKISSQHDLACNFTVIWYLPVLFQDVLVHAHTYLSKV
jgi:hypothetical protein